MQSIAAKFMARDELSAAGALVPLATSAWAIENTPENHSESVPNNVELGH